MSKAKQVDKQVKAFAAWLAARGNTILPTKGQWELLRWRGPAGDGARILYTNKYGDIANTSGPDAAGDWDEFEESQHD